MQQSDVRSGLKRTTFPAADADRAASFCEQVFGWSRWYDNCLPVRAGFPPAAPGDGRIRIHTMSCLDPNDIFLEVSCCLPAQQSPA